MMRIIGISGTNGSGKDTLGEMLAEQYDWLFVSVSDILRDELKHRGEPIERKNLRRLSAEWRRELGLGALINKALEEYERQNKWHSLAGLVISSLRNYGEADRVHELGGQVVWVDADPSIRYKRISARVRSDEDRKTYEEFLRDEQDEMQHFGGDKATLNLQGVKDRADIFIDNPTDDINDFKKSIQRALNL